MASRTPAFILKDVSLTAADGTRIGQCSEIVLPTPEKTVEEFRNAGMVKPREIPLGYNMTEATFTETAFDPDMLALLGFEGSERMIAYGYMRDADGTEHSARVEMIADVKRINPGTWASGQRASTEYGISVHELTLYVDDREIIHMGDFEVRVMGVTQDPGRRSALRL